MMVVGWFAYSSVKPALVEECDNSPSFTLVAAVRGEYEVREGGRVFGRDVVLVEVVCGVEFACEPLECGWRVVVACFT